MLAPASVNYRGVSALRPLLHFLHDPIDGMRTLYRRHGTFVRANLFPPKLHGLARPIAFAFGPDFNRQIFTQPEVWRAPKITLRGPRNSAQDRLSGNYLIIGDIEMQKRQPDGAANGRQPARSETNRTSLAAASRR